MVTNREFVRKKWEDLMRNPLAKELWVTEAANFDDPTYHPLLHLVIDSDDITVIDVDEFEELYSDEEANYWNGISRKRAKDFDPAETGIRNLTCVYRDGQWLDNKQLITKDEVVIAKKVLNRTLKDFREFPCEATVSLLLVRLFETMQMAMSYGEHYDISYDCEKYRTVRKEVFTHLRNSLVRDVWYIGDFKQFIKKSLTEFGRESFSKVCTLCFDDSSDLYTEIMKFCSSQQPE